VAAAGTVIANLLVSRNAPCWNGPMIITIYSVAMVVLWRLDFPPAFVVGFLGVGALSAMRSVATARFADVVSPRNRGLAFGVLETILSLALGVAGGLAGRLYALTPAHDLSFIGVLILAPLLVALWFALWSSLPERIQTPVPSSVPPGDR
jgi:predicted MFS family arabinose efflux permease